jgi:starch phosphorylase
VETSYHVEADIFLGDLSQEDVQVEAYFGRLDPSDQFVNSETVVMKPQETIGDNLFKYRCDIQFKDAGHYGLNIRITPNHPDPSSRLAMGLVIWGQQ